MKAQNKKNINTDNAKRSNSDEYYILSICDRLLGVESIRQHRFDFLRGDSGSKLPVDAYYHELNLVIEFKEKQHTEKVGFFDKRMTVSGMGRGEQRARYDQLRRDILPKHGIDLIEFDYSEFEHTRSKKLHRIIESDTKVIYKKLKKYLKGVGYDK
jgi:very-short-patch-repair endonuclease